MLLSIKWSAEGHHNLNTECPAQSHFRSSREPIRVNLNPATVVAGKVFIIVHRESLRRESVNANQ